MLLDTGVEIVSRIRMAWVLRKVQLFHLREYVKYYFADFVRKGGTPPPFTDKIFAKKKVTDLGGTPPSPFTNISPKNVLEKVLKIVFWAQKHPILVQKIGYGFGGYPPPPLYGFFSEKISSKSAKNGDFCPKNTCFWSKK